MATADRNEPAPPPLELAFMCGDRFLPDAGGIHDQDYRTILLMRTCLNIFKTVQHMRSLVGNQINTHLSHSQRLLLGELQQMGVLGGNPGG